MVDSKIVLYGQTLAYTFYCLAILLVMAWFSIRLTRSGKSTTVKPALFYSFVAFLTILGISLHIITTKTIPWVETDLHRPKITPDKVFNIGVANHKFQLPSEKLVVKTGEKVLFDVTSDDLTYGFGIFRQDNSMVFQMQVVPGHKNDIIWEFINPGSYHIRSTEYSGPKGINMIEENAVQVVAAN